MSHRRYPPAHRTPSRSVWRAGIGIWFSGPGAERLLPGLVSERKRTFDQLFRSLQNPRAAVNAVLGFSRSFGRVLGFRVAGPGARRAASRRGRGAEAPGLPGKRSPGGGTSLPAARGRSPRSLMPCPRVSVAPGTSKETGCTWPTIPPSTPRSARGLLAGSSVGRRGHLRSSRPYP
jgi:hypothetical protein